MQGPGITAECGMPPKWSTYVSPHIASAHTYTPSILQEMASCVSHGCSLRPSKDKEYLASPPLGLPKVDGLGNGSLQLGRHPCNYALLSGP